MKILYHVRHANGTSIDMKETQSAAVALATEESLQVYELKGSIARLIYPAPAPSRSA